MHINRRILSSFFLNHGARTLQAFCHCGLERLDWNYLLIKGDFKKVVTMQHLAQMQVVFWTLVSPDGRARSYIKFIIQSKSLNWGSSAIGLEDRVIFSDIWAYDL